MDRILVEKSPSPGKLDVLGVDTWPRKKLPAGRYTHTYAENEDCYVTEGRAVLSCNTPTTETVADGDLVFIPRGLTVTWEVPDEVRYCYRTQTQK